MKKNGHCSLCRCCLSTTLCKCAFFFGAGMSSPIVIYVMTHMKECMHSMDSCRDLHVEYVGLASFFPELFLIPPSPVDL